MKNLQKTNLSLKLKENLQKTNKTNKTNSQGNYVRTPWHSCPENWFYWFYWFFEGFLYVLQKYWFFEGFPLVLV